MNPSAEAVAEFLFQIIEDIETVDGFAAKDDAKFRRWVRRLVRDAKAHSGYTAGHTCPPHSHCSICGHNFEECDKLQGKST